MTQVKPPSEYFIKSLILVLVGYALPFTFVRNLEPTFFSKLQLFVLWMQGLNLQIHPNLGSTTWTYGQPTMIDLVSTPHLGLSCTVGPLLLLPSRGCSAIYQSLCVVCLSEALISGVLDLDCFRGGHWVWLPKIDTQRVWNMLTH